MGVAASKKTERRKKNLGNRRYYSPVKLATSAVVACATSTNIGSFVVRGVATSPVHADGSSSRSHYHVLRHARTTQCIIVTPPKLVDAAYCTPLNFASDPSSSPGDAATWSSAG